MSVESIRTLSGCSPSDSVASLNYASPALSDSFLPFQMEINRIREQILKRKDYEKTLWENYNDLCFKYLVPPIAGMKEVLDESKPVFDLSVREL